MVINNTTKYDEIWNSVYSKRITILAETVSKNGIQPGLWVSEFGKGRICCFTPGHTTDSLICDGYVKIMKNAIDWCMRMKD